MPPPRLTGSTTRLSSSCRHNARRSLSTSRPLASYSTQSSVISPPAPPPAGAARLTHRRLLTLHGPDATHFLQGLVTANVRPGLTAGFYAAFLSAQGRLLNDVFIYPSAHSSAFTSMLPGSVVAKYGAPGLDTPSYVVEVDANEAERLVKHLKRYRLRAKLDIRLLDAQEWSAWSMWDEKSPWTPHSSPTPSAATTPQDTQDTELVARRPDIIGTHDARAPGMGRRILLSSSETPASLLETDTAQEAPLSAYTIRRMLRGVAEGQVELSRESALPQESNVDFMAGIDFRKGCYVGQELTIRTHHTGVVRKRVLPVQLYTDETTTMPPQSLTYTPDVPSLAVDIPPAANILPANSKRGRSTGRWLAGVGDIGLALCRVETMTDLVLTAEGVHAGDEEDASFVLAPPSTTAGDEDGSTSTRPRLASREPLVSQENQKIKVKAYAPDWLRNQVRVKAPNVRV